MVLNHLGKSTALIGIAAFAAACGLNSKIVERVRYGELTTISGLWFTNFENSRFIECQSGSSSKKCADQPLSEWASIKCENGGCARLDREARRVAPQTMDGPPSGMFTVRFLGRRGCEQHQPRYIGDGGRDVLIEQLLEIRRVEGD